MKFRTLIELGDAFTYIVLRIVQVSILALAIGVFISGFWS